MSAIPGPRSTASSSSKLTCRFVVHDAGSRRSVTSIAEPQVTTNTRASPRPPPRQPHSRGLRPAAQHSRDARVGGCPGGSRQPVEGLAHVLKELVSKTNRQSPGRPCALKASAASPRRCSLASPPRLGDIRVTPPGRPHRRMTLAAAHHGRSRPARRNHRRTRPTQPCPGTRQVAHDQVTKRLTSASDH